MSKESKPIKEIKPDSVKTETFSIPASNKISPPPKSNSSNDKKK